MALGLPEVWVSHGIRARASPSTYVVQALADLPLLPDVPLNGGFEWLPDPGRRLEWAIGASGPKGPFDVGAIPALADEAARSGVAIPVSLDTFLRSERRDWIRSVTGCWLDLPERVVNVPGSDARVIRFLNDQQGVQFWYAAVGPEGEEAVLVSNDLFDAPEPWLDPTEVAETYVCAPSVEAFLLRIWIESEIWFRSKEGTPLTDLQQRYLDTLIGKD